MIRTILVPVHGEPAPTAFDEFVRRLATLYGARVLRETVAGGYLHAVCDKGHEADVIMVWQGWVPQGASLPGDQALGELVRQVPRPIWLWREPMRFPEHMLVAYDGSVHSGRALQMAANLAERAGARLTILNVDEARDGAAQDRKLSHAAAYCAAYAITVERVGVFGGAAESVEAYAASSGCDLLVVGAAGVGYLKGLLFGSVAAQLVARAPCSVLVAK